MHIQSVDICGGNILIGDKITVNEKSFEIKKDITFGEYRKISSINAKLSNLSSQYGDNDSLTPEQITSISTEFAATSEAQLGIMVDFLESTLGLKQKDIDKLELNEAVLLFQEAFKASTQVKKKSNQTSDSPYS